MDDISPELLKQIQEDFTELTAGIQEEVKSGRMSYEEAYGAAFEVGSMLSSAFNANINADVLPDGRMYFNIANKVVLPMLKEEHDLVSQAAVVAQQNANRAAGIGIRALPAEFDEDKAKGIIDRVSSEPYDDIKWILDEPVKTFAKNVVDRTLQKNVEFQGQSGLHPKIVRRASAGACEWCQAVAGTYEYPDVPDDVYRRHANCDCVTEYVDGGKYQDVWSKKTYSEEERKLNIQQRIESAEKRREEVQNRRGHTQLLSPDITNLRDEFIAKSVGAMSRNYDIMDLDTGEMYHLAEGTHLQDKEVFAGKGGKDPYEDAWKYAERYGGNIEDWQHVKAKAWLRTDDGDRYAEVHWSQCEGIGKKEMFLKKWLDE